MKAGFSDSDGLIWITKNSGEDWSQEGKIDTSDVKVLSNQIVFADKQVGWVITAFSIWLTEDAGNSWSEVYPIGDFDYENLGGQPSIFFPVNTDVGWLGMSNNKVLKTANRGKTWENVSPSGEADIYALYCSDENECWVGFGNEGGLSFTSDNGKSWQQMLDAQVRKNLGIKSISFATPQIGWIVAMEYHTDPDSPNKFNGIVLKTMDSGKSWIREKDDFYKNPFEDVKFTDDQNGWIRNKDSVYFTQNGGESWTKVFQLDSVN